MPPAPGVPSPKKSMKPALIMSSHSRPTRKTPSPRWHLIAAAPPAALLSFTSLEKSHGRCERLEHCMSAYLSWFHKSWKWPGLLSVARARRDIQRTRTGPPLTEVHYYLCTIPPLMPNVWRRSCAITGVWKTAATGCWMSFLARTTARSVTRRRPTIFPFCAKPHSKHSGTSLPATPCVPNPNALPLTQPFASTCS